MPSIVSRVSTGWR